MKVSAKDIHVLLGVILLVIVLSPPLFMVRREAIREAAADQGTGPVSTVLAIQQMDLRSKPQEEPASTPPAGPEPADDEREARPVKPQFLR